MCECRHDFTAYVTDEGSNDMSIVDLESGKVTTVAVGQGPRKLVVQGGAKRSVDGGGAKVSIANFAFNPDSTTISPEKALLGATMMVRRMRSCSTLASVTQCRSLLGKALPAPLPRLGRMTIRALSTLT